MIKEYKCRVCASKNMTRLVHLPEMPLTDDFVQMRSTNRSEYKSDIDIYLCRECGIVQNPADFDHENYYTDYQYSSGHSQYVQKFMTAYAQIVCTSYEKINGFKPSSVLEVGSGDGVQLKQFGNLGVERLMGIEPSKYLAAQANEDGIMTEVALFDSGLTTKISDRFDVCISSYTFDHVRDPVDYLNAAREFLSDNGLLALEIHDFDKILSRAEYCLLEHEHTIYLDQEAAIRLINSLGFEVIKCNPLPDNITRANSLLIIARKLINHSATVLRNSDYSERIKNYEILGSKVEAVIGAIDKWIEKIPQSQRLIGYGAGGRGVMTLAAIKNHSKFSCIFDANHGGHDFLTPKTRILVNSIDKLKIFNDAKVIIFSFGYYDEIKELLLLNGYLEENIHSLAEFYGEH